MLEKEPCVAIMTKSSLSEMASDVGTVLSLGILAGLCIGFGAIGGWLIDNYFGTAPWGAGLGIVWGIAASAYNVYKVLSQSIRAFDRRKAEKKHDSEQPAKR